MRKVAPPVDGTHWLNTDPIDPQVWRRRTTVLVFWSMGCEASLSLLHRLDRLRHNLGGELAVTAIHSPRFEDEQDVDRLRRFVRRSGLTLPVLHDPTLTTWGRYDPPGWPAVVLIDHRGKVVASGAGVGTSILAEAIDETRQVAAAARAADRARASAGKRAKAHPLPIPAALPTMNTSGHDRLTAPTGLCVVDDRLVVIDSGNNRMLHLELDVETSTATVIGEVTGFHNPARVCVLDDETVAISEPDLGHVIGVDLPTGTTWAIATGLTRPIGLMRDRDGSIVVADAGADQLIRLIDRGDGAVTQGVIAGTGSSGHDDGPAGRATLAQPIDVARTSRGVAFVDLATSALRILTDGGKVLTSSSASFRQAGLVDGPLPRAMFDRPRALTVLADGSIVVADSGTSRLRLVHQRKVSTLGVGGLDEPEALVPIDANTVLVADTGNDRLLLVDVAAHRVQPVTVSGFLPDTAGIEASATTPVQRRSLDSITVPWPAIGKGPWDITITAEPTTLIDDELTFERDDPTTPISVPLADNIPGSILVTATAADTVHSASIRIDTDVARYGHRIQRPVDDEPPSKSRNRQRRRSDRRATSSSRSGDRAQHDGNRDGKRDGRTVKAPTSA